jgi:hypothetical protein
MARAQELHSGVDARAQKDLKEHWCGRKPISTARLAAELWEAIRREDWVLVHGSLSGWERRLWEMTDRTRCIAGGGGTGTGMGVAMGVALAFRGTGKVCVSIQNDGDLLYTPGSLWTAAHHDIPMLVVMFNNRSYFQDVGHQRAITMMRQRSLENVGVGVPLDRFRRSLLALGSLLPASPEDRVRRQSRRPGAVGDGVRRGLLLSASRRAPRRRPSRRRCLRRTSGSPRPRGARRWRT